MTTPYVCTLDEASQKKALDELKEDPANRQGAIDTFREWILQQKHFTCPTDNAYLIAFLRAGKFSQLEARAQLENFLRQRQRKEDWFRDLDTHNPESLTLIDDGCFFALPGRDKEGRKVFIIRPGLFDVKFKRYKKMDIFRTTGAMLMDYLYMLDETTQVNGTVTIMDLTKMTMKHQTTFTIDDNKTFLHSWQKFYPARIKALHLYKLGPFMEFMMMLIRICMPEKIQKRIILHGTSLESLYKHVPMELLPEEYVPDDYTGPNNGSIRSIVDKMKADLIKPETRERIKYISSSQFTMDMKQKETDVPSASFRKLNVD